MNNWICCQLGAREHYAIPRALHKQGKLKYLITDTWVSRYSPIHLLPKFIGTNLRERYHPELNNAPIKAFNRGSVTWETAQKFANVNDWQRIIERNCWWQQRVLQKLKKLRLRDNNITLFAYSYAALELFEYAKSQGWKIVLGQIDPGVVEEKLVFRESKKYPQYEPNRPVLPLEYWSNWRQECNLADEILVNSPWSAQALAKTGVRHNKIKVIPLAYETVQKRKDFVRTYPENFSDQRPLKVLFLGQVILRKGVAAIFEAIELLDNKPIEFWFVGEVGIKLPKQLKKHPQIKWLGSVPRSQTSHYYRQADVFLFPTLSDGFGLTQLEAQTWKLPLVTSQFCGSVVKDKINGLILPGVSGKAIAQVLNFCFYNPQELERFSQSSPQTLADFSLSKLAQELQTIDTTKNTYQSLVF